VNLPADRLIKFYFKNNVTLEGYISSFGKEIIVNGIDRFNFCY
jgi:hypothetical protein